MAAKVFECHETRSSKKRGKKRWLTYQTWEIATPFCLDVNHGRATSRAVYPRRWNVMETSFERECVCYPWLKGSAHFPNLHGQFQDTFLTAASLQFACLKIRIDLINLELKMAVLLWWATYVHAKFSCKTQGSLSINFYSKLRRNIYHTLIFHLVLETKCNNSSWYRSNTIQLLHIRSRTWCL